VKLPYARVLVVDDIDTNLDVAKGSMKPYGMQVDCMTSGQQAIDAICAEEGKYDAIFMDHMMPGMDGIETTRWIRNLGTDYAKNIPIIALTANAIAGNEEMFIREGFQAFLPKPIDISRLDDVIRHWVRDKNKEKEDAVIEENSEDNQDETVDQLLENKIEGLDIVKGLERYKQNEEIYIHILRSYVKNTPKLLDSIKNIDKDSLPGYAITVHGIKGTSRSISADYLGNLAEELEMASKAGDFDFVSKNNDKFTEALEKLIADIEKMLAVIYTKKSKPKKGKPDIEILSKLLAACRDYDMDAVDEAMAEIENYEYESDDGLAEWLHENVRQMNFKEIIDKLSVLIN
jgi:CheY-like chemotaxis protein